MPKVLDAAALHATIDRTLTYIHEQQENVRQLEKAVKGIVSLEGSLKGQGGTAIRFFFQTFHVPFLTYYSSFLTKYENALNDMGHALEALEPDPNGFIHESFLQGEVEDGLEQTKNKTVGRVSEIDQAIADIRDIIDLPSLQEDEVVHHVWRAKKRKEQTLEQLYAFDAQQTNAIDALIQDVETMGRFVETISNVFQTSPHYPNSSKQISDGIESAKMEKESPFIQQVSYSNGKEGEENYVEKSIESFGEIGKDFWNATEERAEKSTNSWYDFFNWLTIGAVDATWRSAEERDKKKFDSPYDFFNYIGIGIPDLVGDAVIPFPRSIG